MFLKIFSFALVCFLAVCGNLSPGGNAAQPSPAGKAELSLTMERTRCYGICPAYKLEVRPDGKIIFEGFDFTEVKGKAEDRLSEEKIKQLTAEINKAGLFSLKDDYTVDSGNCPSAVTDNPTVKISVKLGEQEKTITHYLGCGDNDDTKKLYELENKIDEIVGTKRWIGERK